MLLQPFSVSSKHQWLGGQGQSHGRGSEFYEFVFREVQCWKLTRVDYEFERIRMRELKCYIFSSIENKERS